MTLHEPDPRTIQAKLLEWLHGRMPQASNLTISNMERSGAGFTSETFLFDLDWDEGGVHRSQGMLLRSEGTQHPVYPDPKVRRQYRILERLNRTDVPVPKVYWFEEDESLLGSPFYVMGKLEGAVPSEFPPYHSFGICFDATPRQRERMWWELINAVVRLHKLDWKALDFAFLGAPSEGTGPVDQDLDYWERYLDFARDYPGEPHPILEAALDWLRQNRYEPDHVSICWGDARMPNAIFAPDGKLLGLLDWDICHLGDPESDLAFILTLDHLLGEAIGTPRLEGFPSKDDAIRRYEQLTGRKVKNLFYNEVRAACVTGLHVVRVQRNLRTMGVNLPGEDPDRDNFCTQYLAGLLGLPSPSTMTATVTPLEDITATIQFHLTGPGGSDWYLAVDRGEIARHDGTIPSPTATITVSAHDWAAIQRGELKRFHAWTTGKLTIEGDSSIVHRLEDKIAALGT